MKTERQARLKTLQQNLKHLETKVTGSKQAIEKVLYKDKPLVERIYIIFRELGITRKSILTVSGERASAGSEMSSPKEEGVFKNLVNRLVDALKILAGKVVEVLPAIVGSDVGVILSRFCN